MRTAFMTALLLVTLFLSSFTLSAQDAYRTNFSGSVGQWNNAAHWERFNAAKNVWEAAAHYPTYLDGVITIQAGDSLMLFGADTLIIDQVIVSKGGVLVLTRNEENPVILHDGEGNDIIVNGKMHVEAKGALRGKGNIHVDRDGIFTLKNSLLGVSLNNDGIMYWGASDPVAGVFTGCNIVNNNSCVWMNGGMYMDSAVTFVNNGKIEIFAASNLVWKNNRKQPSKLINKGAILNKAKDFAVDINVRVDNQGTIGGVGTFLFSGGVSNGGVISPGASPGHLTLGPGTLRSAIINIEIATTGAIAGLNYDRLTVASLQDLNGATIHVTDAAGDSVNTEYTIIDAETLVSDKPYPDVTIHTPGNFSWAFIKNKLILKKTAAEALAVSWGGFKAVAKGNKVALDWNAAVDKRTSYFVVEHSTDAVTYVAVGKVEAQHGAGEEARYGFEFTGTDVLKTNYFRIKQVNADGKSGYSVARNVKFDKGIVVALQTHADMENDELQLNIQAENVSMSLNDQAGRSIQQFAFSPGQHAVYLDSLPAGTYRVSFFVKEVMVETKQIVKQ